MIRVIGKSWAGKSLPCGKLHGWWQAKALVEDAEQAPSTAPADAATGAGVGGGTIAGTLSGLQDQLSPLSYASEWIGRIVVVLAIISVILVACEPQGSTSRRGSRNGSGVMENLASVLALASGAAFTVYELIKHKGADELRARRQRLTSPTLGPR